MATLYLNQEFSTWKDFFEAVELHCRQTYQPFIKVSSKSCEFSNSRLKPGQQGYPPELGYAYFVYKCTHRGTFRSLSKEKRHIYSFKQGCKAKIYAAVDKETKTKIVVRQLNEDHCHEIGPDLYFMYTNQRAISSEEEKKLVNKMTKKNMSNLLPVKVADCFEQESSKKNSGLLKRSYNHKQLQEAVSKVQSGELEINKAAKVYKVPNTTLREWLARRDQEDSKTLLNKLEENKLAVWLLEMAKTGFRVTQQSIRDAVRNIFLARDPPVNYYSDSNRPSKKWMLSFFSRYPEVSVSYSNVFATSVDASTTRTSSTGEWFSKVKNYLDTVDSNLLLSADRLYAADEIYFRLTADGNKVKTCDGTKFIPGSSPSSHITVIGCASAGGHLLYPFAVFPFTKMPTYNPMEDFSDGMFQISPDGQLTSLVFLSWLKDCFIPSVAHQQKPVVLFVDTKPVHSSNVDIVDLCMQNSIILYCIDDVDARVISPLEQPFFKHISKMWETLAGASVVLHKEIPSQQTFASVLKDSWSTEANYDLAVDGFARSGIFPFASPEAYETFSLDKQASLKTNADSFPEDEIPSPLSSGADADSMDHLLVTQVSSEAVAATQSVECKSTRTKPQSINTFQAGQDNQIHDKNSLGSTNHLLPNTVLGTPSIIHNAPVSTSLLNQQLPVSNFGQPYSNYATETLSHSPQASTPAFHLNQNQCHPMRVQPQSTQQLSNPSQSASMSYIRLLLRMAFSYGEAISFDVLNKYAAGQNISPFYKDMVDCLNTILKLDNIQGSAGRQPPLIHNSVNHVHREQPWITQQSFVDQVQATHGAQLNVGSFDLPQSSQFMSNQNAYHGAQAQSTRGSSSQGLATQLNANLHVIPSFTSSLHRKEEADRWRGDMVNSSNQSQPSSTQKPTQNWPSSQQDGKNPTFHKSQQQRPSPSHSDDQQHCTDPPGAPISLPVALTGRAFAVYLDVKRRERENKLGKSYGKKMRKKRKVSNKIKGGQSYFGQTTKELKENSKMNTEEYFMDYGENQSAVITENSHQDVFVSVSVSGPSYGINSHENHDGVNNG